MSRRGGGAELADIRRSRGRKPVRRATGHRSGIKFSDIGGLQIEHARHHQQADALNNLSLFHKKFLGFQLNMCKADLIRFN